jgi:rhodanese-related sulfurtransferase
MPTKLIFLDVMIVLILSNAAIKATPAQTGASPGKMAEVPRIKLTHPEVPRIPAKEVKEMLAKKADFVLVDTSPADYFDLWHIPTAINIPYITMADDPSKKESMLGKLPRDKLIVVYCSCEEGADSSEVVLMLRQMDYRRDKVKVLEGGMIKWDEAGYPMLKTKVPE